MNDGDATEVARPCSCKVGRAVRKYDLGAFDAVVRDRHRDGASLRDLERFVNERILRGALEAAGTDVIGDVDDVYDALTDDDVSAGRRTEVRERLTHAGVDVDALLDDFVSYQTVRTHLRECLDVDTDRREPLTVEDARGTIEWSRSRSEGIVSRTLERLANEGAVDAGDLDVSQVLRVSCADCGATATVDEFVDRGGCDCGE